MTVLSGTTTEVVIELTDYSDLNLIEPVSLTWNPTLPSTFVVSSIEKTYIVLIIINGTLSDPRT